ncbi:MAG TPA: (2Fe-2S)-binding protein [Actinophytocola sp.]|uniref:(2Fe-2S)-binding protein n=1 Tax=Actinophytocola sp. TaxID=1872138 RepID=UPI002DDD317B|nr:(2Fe-2S)-binding protein [Actinophytocola sp.]HEV2781658.1 (2Fe-2S)-binding protein [Actinophytocola sp.]
MLETNGLLAVPGSKILEPGWLRAQVVAAARRYRFDRRPALGVLWWYSASSVLIGPPVESLLATGTPAHPGLAHLTLLVHPDGRVLDARSDATLPRDTLGRHLHATLSATIGAVAEVTAAPPRALWAIATDSLANRVLWAGGTPDVAEELAAAIGPDLPTPRFTKVCGHLVVRRASCCLIYEAPGIDKCTSCPRQTPEERRSRLEAAYGGA